MCSSICLRSISIFLFITTFTFQSKAQDTASVSAGHLYIMSEHGIIPNDRLQNLANVVRRNFDSAGIIHSQASAVDSFPTLQPLDALVIYLDTDMAPKDVGPEVDDCPMQGHNVGESDILAKESYVTMKQRLAFDYDAETVRGSVVYICPGRLLFLYRLQRMFADKEDGPLTEKNIDLIFASAATHEVAHTLGAVHVFRTGDPLYIPAEGYFLGSVVSYADESIRFHERNITKMREFIHYARDSNENMNMQILNDKKSMLLYDLIIQ